MDQLSEDLAVVRVKNRTYIFDDLISMEFTALEKALLISSFRGYWETIMIHLNFLSHLNFLKIKIDILQFGLVSCF